MFNASIKVLGKIYKSHGETVYEALKNLQAPRTREKSILVVWSNKWKKERILNMFQTSRLFHPSATIREVALKNVSLLFDSKGRS